MLSSTIARLDDSISGSGEMTPIRSIDVSLRSKRKRDSFELASTISEHMGNMSKASLIERLSASRKAIAEYEVEEFIASSEEEKEIWKRVRDKEISTEQFVLKQLENETDYN